MTKSTEQTYQSILYRLSNVPASYLQNLDGLPTDLGVIIGQTSDSIGKEVAAYTSLQSTVGSMQFAV